MGNVYRVAVAVTASPTTTNFSALTDLSGNTLPATFNAAPTVLSVEPTDALSMGRSFYASTTTTQLRILPGAMGDPLPVNVMVTLLAGAESGVADDYTLLYIRTKLVDLSGHYELVTDAAGGDYSDAGADFHIRAGQRILDLMQDHPRTLATYKEDVVDGDHTVTFKYNRSIEKVEVTDGSSDSTEGRTPLEKVELDWLREEYKAPIANLDTGRPIYYSRAIIGLAPEQIGLTAAGGASPYTAEFTYDYEDLTFGQDNLDRTGIAFYPPSDGTYTITVKGRWFSRPLVNDSDISFWSVNYEDALVLAAMMSIEKIHRNTQGVNDMRDSIRDILFGIDKDMSSDDAAEIDFVNPALYTRS
ncbi:MAG: hypothetical protein ACXABY_21505 [Candidatus Thorarchaeota archaeon]